MTPSERFLMAQYQEKLSYYEALVDKSGGSVTFQRILDQMKEDLAEIREQDVKYRKKYSTTEVCADKVYEQVKDKESVFERLARAETRLNGIDRQVSAVSGTVNRFRDRFTTILCRAIPWLIAALCGAWSLVSFQKFKALKDFWMNNGP